MIHLEGGERKAKKKKQLDFVPLQELKAWAAAHREWHLGAVNPLSTPAFTILFGRHPPPTPALLFQNKSRQMKALLQ